MRGGTRRKARRRYSADEVSRCGRWMQRAGGVALFPGGRDERMRRLPSSRGCTARLCFGSTPGGTLLGEADCTGLDPEAVYVYGERVEGRARRPPQRASTVARNKAARWKATKHRASHSTPTSNAKRDEESVSDLLPAVAVLVGAESRLDKAHSPHSFVRAREVVRFAVPDRGAELAVDVREALDEALVVPRRYARE